MCAKFEVILFNPKKEHDRRKTNSIQHALLKKGI